MLKRQASSLAIEFEVSKHLKVRHMIPHTAPSRHQMAHGQYSYFHRKYPYPAGFWYVFHLRLKVGCTDFE
jgi:hypothetical protein